jgi:hypothetical protein|uniref:Uncharacterized protein n=1 Tax=Picea glauca TaxID=3330 RepID=A0A124GNQ5_PICGL|nr:hypothetical protein ABT39_MTgene2777 [Picea glauca]
MPERVYLVLNLVLPLPSPLLKLKLNQLAPLVLLGSNLAFA